MSYQCLDCTYKGKHFPAGCCPGCGSRRIKKIEAGQTGQLKARKPYRLMLAIALWFYLLWLLYQKLN